VNKRSTVPGRHDTPAGNRGTGPHRPINVIVVVANIFSRRSTSSGLVFHRATGGSCGGSIVGLPDVVHALLLPLAFKQMHSMHKLQQVTPRMTPT
jgi:membrane protein insertase Oxa1/YidC/SpoIIIJ